MASPWTALVLGALLAAPDATTPLFDRGLAAGCTDLGWAPREVKPGAPASIDFSAGDGWMISCTQWPASPSELHFRVKASEPPAQFLEVQLDADGVAAMPRVSISKGALRESDGWTEVSLPFALLGAGSRSVQRLMFRASHPVPGRVLLDGISVTGGASAEEPAPAPAPAAAPTPPESHPASAPHPAANSSTRSKTGASSNAATPPAAAPAPAATPASAPPAEAPKSWSGPSRSHGFAVRCDRPAHPISPAIYGVGYATDDPEWDRRARELGATARRWGGNTSSRYNWQLGNAWNTASDWFYENVGGKPGPMWKRFLEANDAEGVPSAISIPMIGWVSKDTTSVSFPVSAFGAQKAVASDNPNAGNGISSGGEVLEPLPPTTTSVAATPEFEAEWVRAIKQVKGSRRTYILDNEPGLWASTHRDVHPEPLGYDEQLERTIAYASAIRASDPQGLIAGPAEWGWSGYFWSAKDLAPHGMRLDRLRHGNKALLPWWLGKVAEAEKKQHVKLLDVLDVHFYPQGDVGIGLAGGTDDETAARRFRSTRGLWDPSYTDESWINEPIELIPRLRRWIAEEHPGLPISIGEWNFGAENHIAGGLTTAEVLGIFGVENISSAYYWALPAERSASAWAFRAFRNFDGKGGRFLDSSISTEGKGAKESLFVSRDGDHLVAVMLNFDAHQGLDAAIDLQSCGAVESAQTFTYTGGPQGFGPPASGGSEGRKLRLTAPPYSISVIDLRLAAKR